MPIASSDNIQQWGGTAVSAPPATGIPATGSEIAPVVKPLFRRNTVVLNPTLLGANATYTGPWYDTNITGDTHTYVTVFADQGATSNGFQIYGTDDTTNTRTQSILVQTYASVPNTAVSLACRLKKRYWRIVFNNGSTAQTAVFTISFNTSNTPMELTVTGNGVYSTGFVTGDIIAVSPLGNVASTDGQSAQSSSATNGVQAYYGVATAAFNGVTWDRTRTPSFFKTYVGNAANGTVWTPTASAKFRLMRYKIQLSAAAKATTAGEYFINFNDGALGGITSGGISIGHNIFIPSTSATTLGLPWESDWVDLGNGYLSLAAGQVLSLGLNSPLSAVSQNAGFTQTSGQWESGQLIFETNGGATTYAPSGVLIQGGQASSTSTSLAKAFVKANQAGNTLVVVYRVSSGTAVPTISADTLGNTYQSLTTINNATDGSTIRAFYCVGCKGGANTITVASNVASAAQELLIFEYSGITSFVTSSGTTGNSTAPAPGAASATTTSAVVMGYAGNGGASNALVAGSGFSLRNSISNATGSLALEDSLNQGIAGIVGMFNVITAGTEE